MGKAAERLYPGGQGYSLHEDEHRVDHSLLLLDELTALSARAEGVQWFCRICGQQNFIYRNPVTGRLFFRHGPGGSARHDEIVGHGGGESDEHQALKVRLADTVIRRPNWTARLEARGPGGHCVSDVLASNTKTGKQMPIEAQLAGITPEAVVRRSRANGAAWSEMPLWIHTGQREWSPLVPSARLCGDDPYHPDISAGVFTDNRGDKLAKISVVKLVGHWLAGRVSFIEHVGIAPLASDAYLDADGNICKADHRRAKAKKSSHDATVSSNAPLFGHHGATTPTALEWGDDPPPAPVLVRGTSYTPMDGGFGFSCPRCGDTVVDQFYGPCAACRRDLRVRFGGIS